MLEKEETEKDKKVPQRKTLKKFDFLDSSDQSSIKNPNLLDGFYLVLFLLKRFKVEQKKIKEDFERNQIKSQMQLCCVEDPLDLSTIDISDKHLNQVDIYLILNI